MRKDWYQFDIIIYPIFDRQKRCITPTFQMNIWGARKKENVCGKESLSLLHFQIHWIGKKYFVNQLTI